MGLMKLEQQPDVDFESVDMAAFFWVGISFLILYRFVIFVYSIYDKVSEGGPCYGVFLAMVDLYIFGAIYESFSAANNIITDNAKKRAAHKKQRELEIAHAKEIELANKAEAGAISTTTAEEFEATEVEPSDKQMIIQLVESVVESMPQIVLQSVFIIRSANDIELAKNGSNIALLLMSITASLFSISNKFAWLDKENVRDDAKALKSKLSFPNCIKKFYVVRILW